MTAKEQILFNIFTFILFPNIFFEKTLSVHVNLAYKQFTNTSSTYSLLHKSFLAVDGVFETQDHRTPGCTHTFYDQNPWLIILLRKQSIIRVIRILNRSAANERLSKLFIKTSLISFTDITDYNKGFQTFAYMNDSFEAGASKTLVSDSFRLAKTILFYLDKRIHLTFCEIEIWCLINIAKRKPVYQRSTSSSNRWANMSVDNHNSGQLQGFPTCSETDEGIYNWWKIDLLAEYIIFAVTTFGARSQSHQLKNISIDVSPIDFVPSLSHQQKCIVHADVVPEYFTFNCLQWTIGRYLSIMKNDPSDNSKLLLCEVDIFGYKVEKGLEIFPIIINETNYNQENYTFTEDCIGNKKVTINISKYKINSINVDLKGVGLMEQCHKERYPIWMGYEKEESKIVDCELKGIEDGYFTSAEIFDVCKFTCNDMNVNIIRNIFLYFKSPSDIKAKEIYVVISS